ncbi:hypothetical protein JCM5296_001120 [Sporobolomyces johnsonii]
MPRAPAAPLFAWATLGLLGVPPGLAQTVSSTLFSSSAINKVLSLASSSSTTSTWPEYTSGAPDNTWVLEPESDWTSFSFPSTLYLLNERDTVLCPGSSNGTDWLGLARAWSAGLYDPSSDVLASWTHDVGFNSLPMADELLLNPGNTTARDQLLSNAQVLAGRFSDVVGCTRSWDRGAGDFEVIIDNMMNLQLFIEAYRLTGNSTYLDMATSHANKTMQNHVRDDGSSFHVVDYSPTTGAVQWRGTAQGFSNSSTWSRGQAWGSLGFALMYNATGIQDYLETSRRMATFFIDGLPSSGVSYWDFNATLPTTLDTSASTIMSSALLLLSSLESSLGNSSAASRWSTAAVTLLDSVVDQAVTTWDGASIIGNGTVNNRADPPSNNTGIVYGDQYFIQSGNYLLALGLANCTDGARAVGASPTALSSSSSGGSGANSSSSTGSASSSSGEKTSAAPRRRAGAPPTAFRRVREAVEWIASRCTPQLA